MKRHILLSLTALLCSLSIADSATAQPRAATNIRYVAKNGKYNNSGLSWAEAKNNIQDAINDLADQGLQGEVWVARGVYTPTESTEGSGGSTLYMSFKVPAGITVRGGFFGPGEVPGRVNKDSLTYFKQLLGNVYKEVVEADSSGVSVDIANILSGNYFPGEDRADQRARYVTTRDRASNDTIYPYISTLSGDLSQAALFEWNDTKQYWNTSFYGNCYHVVWFATNGFYDDGRAKALDPNKGDAAVEGFTIMDGNARNTTLTGRTHNAYGGGAYMVEGSRLENCNIIRCEASRDGGGIYMDGGGVVKHCYINNCQALGTSVENGYGGGVCLDGNKAISSDIFGMYRSVVSGCAARYGGGVAVKSEKANDPNGKDLRTETFVSGTAVFNNTATTEGGGVYMLNGGAMSNLTITRNKCTGTGIITGGITTGRAGGLYCRDYAVVMNSVIWGNECKANNDIQFASSQSQTGADYKVRMYYCALSHSNQTDWSSTSKEGIFQVSTYNTRADQVAAGATVTENDHFVNFINPTPNAGYVAKAVPDTTLSETQMGLHRYYNWQPGANSALANAGIVSNDLNIEGNLPFRAIPADVLGIVYNSRSTLGAYSRQFSQMTPIWVGTADNGFETGWHFFVDPDFDSQLSSVTHGVSWDSPAHYLGNVLESIKTYKARYGTGTGMIDKENNYVPGTTPTSEIIFAPEERIYVHVKEGTVTNTNSYTSDRVRNVTLTLSSDVTLLGGYPEALTGTLLEDGDLKRNPVWYPTFVSGDITGDYAMNASHLFTIVGTEATPLEDITIDGFNIRNANARSTEQGNTITDGGGITIYNATNVSIRNSIVAGCTATRGAALLIHNGREVTVENCIFHNNESKSGSSVSGTVYIGSSISDECLTTFKHCNVMNNVGYSMILDGNANSKVRWENSAIFANMKTARATAYYTADDHKDSIRAFKDYLLPIMQETNGYDNTEMINCLYDSASYVNGVRGELSCQLNTVRYPRFVNGVKNVGVSIGGDETFYGRGTSFEPHNENPMVNAATYSGSNTTWGTDMTAVITRDYGGLPDIGAIENHAATAGEGNENAYADGQPAYGSVYYVRTTADGGNDNNTGTSWNQALATIQKATSIAQGAVWTQTGNSTTITYNAGDMLPDLETMIAAGSLQIRCAGRTSNVYWNSTEFYDYNGNEQRLTGTVGTGNTTYFTFEKVNGSDTEFYIKDYQNRYLTGDVYQSTDNITFTNSTTGRRKFQLKPCSIDGAWAIWCTNPTNNDTHQYFNAYTESNISGWKDADGNSSWNITTVNMFNYAAPIYEKSKDGQKIYVAAGTYTGNFKLKEGVSVYGGFPAEGNPGQNERNISNIDPHYKTILDAQSNGCVLTQEKEFSKDTTMYEGFIIQNGSATGTSYGAGAHLQKGGMLKNCKITNNTFTSNGSSVKGGGGVYMKEGIVKNCQIVNNKLDDYSGMKGFGGAGAFVEGGTFQNSLIVANTTYSSDSKNILGAGLYITAKSNLYNCTIAYNVARGKYSLCFNKPATGGVWDNGASNAYNNNGKTPEAYVSGASHFYNCIIWGNVAYGNTAENFFQIGMSGFGDGYGRYSNALHNSYSSGALAYSSPNSNTRPLTFSSDDDSKMFEISGYGTSRTATMKIRQTDSVYFALVPSNSSETDEYKLNTNEVSGYDNNNKNNNNYVDQYLKNCHNNSPFLGDSYGVDPTTLTYELKPTSMQCINKGGSMDVLEEMEITEDIVGSDRVIDCTLDKGAYEYYDSYAITPKTIKKDDGTIDEDKPATFYVTPNGRGLASGDSPGNAACADKLQRILDAAGRYKFRHPNQQIIVKVAYSSSHKNDANPTDFKYYATRTTDMNDANVRVYSIIVPRGVEVWGGYSDAFTDENNNGFYTNTVDGSGKVTNTVENRNITGNPTFFDSYYYNDELASGINTYHVVTFTDNIYDGNGKPYLQNELNRLLSGVDSDPNSQPTTANPLLTMGAKVTYNSQNYGGIKDRAVVDGIHITGGQADLKSYSTGASTQNINRYGGAAIVTDYAHVRNCIVRGNSGVYGGALALTGNALVSGCLIDHNEAEYGGAIYVFEDNTRLSDGTIVTTTNNDYSANSQNYDKRYDYRMARIYASTIVNNNATKQGGGVWYGVDNANVRFNSSVLWQNQCPDQPNVSGVYNITRNDGETYHTTEYYPFNYCALQDIQASGLGNVSLMPENANGARFHNAATDPNGTDLDAIAKETTASGFDKYSYFGYYGLTNNSILNGNGMPVSEWEKLLTDTERNYGLSETDFMEKERDAANTGSRRTNIDIGARAITIETIVKQLMLRLFVADVKDTDINAINAMINAGKNLPETDLTANEKLKQYYSQKGSSFAYPFTSLQDALTYIYTMRGLTADNTIDTSDDGLLKKYNANEMAFEIYVGPGTYRPTLDLTNQNADVNGHTFLIPEGVSIMGGLKPSFAITANGKQCPTDGTHFYGKFNDPDYFDPREAGTTAYEARQTGQYYVDSNKKRILNDDNTTVIESVEIEHLDRTYTIHHVDKDSISKYRTLSDNNANSVVEPWEFEQQTILSGLIEGNTNNGVNHVVTIMANQTYSGALPTDQGVKYTETGTDVGYMPHEHGQIIAFDGITVTGGYAYGYQENTITDAHKLDYVNGGGMLIDTNQYFDLYNKTLDAEANKGTVADTMKTADYRHLRYNGSVGYREIPVMINRCRFNNNMAGYGGAISSNSTLDVINSSFEQNRAMAGRDTVDMIVPERDGTAIRTAEFISVYPGAGGAIYGTHQVTAVNTIFENNEAYDAAMSHDLQDYYTLTERMNAALYKGGEDAAESRKILGGSGGAVFMARKGHFHFLNCNFVRNAANTFPAIYTLNPNKWFSEDASEKLSLKDYNQAMNTVFWGNDILEEMKEKHKGDADYNNFMFKVNKAVNYGHGDRSGLYDPSLTGQGMPTTQDALDNETQTGYMEQLWFCAYEKERGKTPVNSLDLRDMEFKPRTHIIKIIMDELDMLRKKNNNIASDFTYQNCNILLSSDNAENEGPNFVNPSIKAGYDGYIQSADWSPARLNNLTDYGWGKILQEIQSIGDTAYVTRFVKYGDKYGNNQTASIPDDRDPMIYETNDYFVTWGAYPAIRNLKGNEKYLKTIPLGDQPYMYTTYTDNNGNIVPLYRISYDPNPTHNQTYIDIGVYEYHHTQLEYTTEGDEVDVIWVSAIEKPDNGLPDGSAWSQPTSDLQRAIETLLSSRNGHRKEIRMMDGTHTPTYTIDNKLTFYIDTEYQNRSIMLEAETTQNGTETSTTTKYGKGVMSLTIKGGYSHQLNGVRDVDEYKAIIRQQTRTDGIDSNHRWDHLFYIKDPTQRYGAQTYGETNHDGNYKTESDHSINTIPIQFEGVTLINGNASANTKGAVIHYADLDTAATKTVNSVTTHYDSDGRIDPTAVNITTKYESVSKHDWDVIENPAKIILNKTRIIGSGAHNQNGDVDRGTASAVYLGNNGGHALLYNNVFHDNYGNPLVGMCEVRSLNNTFALNGGFVDLGNEAATNLSYIHNSVLWRNNPNTGENATGYGEQFKLNGAATTTVDGKEVFDVTNNEARFKYNAYTGGDTNLTDYNVTGTNTIAGNHYNVGLIDSNDDIIHSPRFIDPDNATIELKNFALNPSLRLMHKGDSALYLRPILEEELHTFVDDNGNVLKNHQNQDSTRIMMKLTADSQPVIYDLAYEPSYNLDAASMKRIVSAIDLGAYEYQQTMNRVIYVDPEKENEESNDGKTWERAYGWGGLQNAIDMAGLYHYNNQSEQAFVFVKGSNDRHTNEEIILRNGVSLYGGIHPLFTAECRYTTTDASGAWTYNIEDIKAYLAIVEDDNEGHIGPNTQPTSVTGIKTDEFTTFYSTTEKDDALIFTLVDGIHVTATRRGNTEGKVKEPVIYIDPKVSEGNTAMAKVALRNIVVHDNDISGVKQTDGRPANIAYMKNALLYSALLRNNTTDDSGDGDAGATLLLDDNAWAVSITAEGKTATNINDTYGTPYNGQGFKNKVTTQMTEAQTRIVNSLVNFRGYTNEDELEIANQTKMTLTGWNYRRASSGDRNLYYQLVEGSKHINEIKVSTAASDKSYLPEDMGFLKNFIDYKTDRDLLGNPRLLTLTDTEQNSSNPLTDNTALLDRGAFETWYVNKDTRTSTTGHFTPHTGSVVYIMENKKLILGDDGTDLQPGFLLIKDGAGLYGNGKNVKVAFVSVERKILPQGSVVSMPFPMIYKPQIGHTEDDNGNMVLGTDYGYCIPKYNDQTDAAQGILSLDCRGDEEATIYTYNGEGRSDFDYVFATDQSGMWKEWSDTNDTIPANTGILFKPKDLGKDKDGKDVEEVIYAFTAQASSITTYIYEEDASEMSKSVVLKQYDDRTPDNGGDFTSKENMGWNCIGLPYLVSDYRTHDHDYAKKAEGDATPFYNMQTPKTLWLYYKKKQNAQGNYLTPDGSAEIDGDGGYYSVKSWDITDNWHLPTDFGDPRIWVGEGIFTQTAAVGATETLTFYRPIPTTSGTGNNVSPAPKSGNTRYYAGDEAIEDRMEMNLNIRVRRRTVSISGLKGGEHIAIYDAAGRLYAAGTASKAPEDSVIGTQYSTTLPATGVYIIAVDGTRKKVAVK